MFTGSLSTLSENFMQIRWKVFWRKIANEQTERETDKQ